MAGIEELSARNAALEAELAEVKHRLSFLSAAIDNMPNPIFMKGKGGRFVFFNRKYAECFGMSREEYIGGTVLDLEYLPEEERRRYQQEDLRVIDNGEINSYDKNFLFKDGIVHPTFYWSKGFVCPENGEHGLIGEIVDVSGPRRLHENLTEIVRGTAHLFECFYVVDLKNGVYSEVKKSEEARDDITVSMPYTDFFEKAQGRFFNPIDQHLIRSFFSVEGLHSLLKAKNDYYCEFNDRNHENVAYGATLYCIERENGVPTKVIYALRDISGTKTVERDYRRKLKEANARLKDLANHDVLTGLYNRRGLMEAISTKLTEYSRVAMLLIDVDNFKSVNDTFGHFAGDNLLVRVADLLRTTFRRNDILVRMGGDEFLAILKDCEYQKDSFVGKKIAQMNEILQRPTQNTPAGSLSVGVAFSRRGETQTLYDRADAALYKVKERGRCGCCVYEDTFETE